MNAPSKDFAPTRRALVVGAAATAGGALLVGCSPADVLGLGAPKMDFGAFGPFIRIEPDGSVTVVSKHIEVGQGTHAGLAAIVAEELDADWATLKVVQAPANAKVYANGMMGVQGTGGSSAISNSWDQLRTAGAAARTMFVEAAATKLSAPAESFVAAASTSIARAAAPAVRSWSHELEIADEPPVPCTPIIPLA